MEVTSTSSGTDRKRSSKSPTNAVGYSTKFVTSSNKSGSRLITHLFFSAISSIWFTIICWRLWASAITNCSSNFSSYSLGLANATWSPKKRCPSVVRPVWTSNNSNGITSSSNNAMIQWIGRTYSNIVSPQCIMVGKFMLFTTSNKPVKTSLLSFPWIYFVT